MLGKNVRGLRHLWRLLETPLTKRKILIRSYDRGFDVAEVFKSPSSHVVGERMFILNSFYNQTNYSWDSLSCDNILAPLFSDQNRKKVLEISKKNDTHNYSRLFLDITLLPEDFDKQYQAFLKSNAKLFKTLSSKYGFDETNGKFMALFALCDGSKNFIQWAANHYFQGTATISSIRNILCWNENYGQLVKNLSKGTITAYTSKDSIWELTDELTALRKEKRINDTINSFNTQQKKILKGNELSESDKAALAKFSKLSETKRVNFIRKMSTIEDFQEIMRQLKHVTSTHFEWSKESFMDYMKNVEGINYELIFENDNAVLVKVKDYETIKQLAKTTNWCISKNKTYWNNYVAHTGGASIQYILFDFSKLEDSNLSIVGLTVTRNKGITSAHNFINDNLLNNSTYSPFIKSFISRFKNNNDIYSIIGDCGIDITLIAEYDKPNYKWDRESLFKYLYECVDEENVNIIKSDGKDPNKVVLSVKDSNIRYFFGDSYIENIDSSYWDEQHIIFIDFSASQYSPNKIKFGIILNGNNEDTCTAMYNELSVGVQNDFDCKLNEFGVPYDIIKRIDNDLKKIRGAFYDYNTELIKDILKKDPSLFMKAMDEYIDADSMYDRVQASLNDYMSFDYLDIVYGNGQHLNDFMSSEYIGDLLLSQICKIQHFGSVLEMSKNFKIPTDEQINDFFNEKINDISINRYVGHYLFLKTIMDRELGSNHCYEDMYGKMVNFMWHRRMVGEMPLKLIKTIIPLINIEVYTDIVSDIMKYCIIYGDDELLARAEDMSKLGNSYSTLYKIMMEEKSKRKKDSTVYSFAMVI